MIKEITEAIPPLKKAIGDWVAKETGIVTVSADTLEVATTAIDAYGDTVYCFVQKQGTQYLVTDDSRILFKLDPGVSDTDLYQTAAEMAIGSGYDFDEATCAISMQVDQTDVVQTIVKLAQLQVAISYLG
ncbi:DUF1828 domain-containing protein [Lactobacillus sp. ESL0785]|uniref:DUF1828 domain-containing protein n=1 Tax=Lactobacillus sp. ESL0785 TaxID=2983232 RepID=UPI0023FA1FA1|nr:DUF1828 domain-containing protein [Lactobacillus sp. ESL0785]WEV71538.1 DUF1828 domain-containing protein [Lactobacillus sp. ESL0785]